MMSTIFMIHGMWGGGWYWENYKDFFEGKGFRCIRPYLRHHNVNPKDKPPKGLGGTGLKNYVSDLEAEITKLPEKPILIGHSMGGLLSLMLAGRHLARAVVMITPASPAGINALKWSVQRSFAGPLLKFKWLGFPHRLSFNATVYAMMHLLLPDEQRYIYDRSVAESGRAVREIGFWAFDVRTASRVKPGTVQCPLLIIGASEDRITPAKVVKKTADKYAHVATYKEYQHHAHSIIWEKGWEKVAEDIYQWFEQI